MKTSINGPHGSLFLILGITSHSSGKHFVESATPLSCHPSSRELEGSCQVVCRKARSSEELPVGCVELDERQRANEDKMKGMTRIQSLLSSDNSDASSLALCP